MRAQFMLRINVETTLLISLLAGATRRKYGNSVALSRTEDQVSYPIIGSLNGFDTALAAGTALLLQYGPAIPITFVSG